jgi:hypothetical protein
LIDNHTEGKVDIHFAPHMRARVKRVFKVHKMDGVGWVK